MERRHRHKLINILGEIEKRQEERPPVFVRCDDEGFPIDEQGNRTGEPQIEGGMVFTLDMGRMSGGDISEDG